MFFEFLVKIIKFISNNLKELNDLFRILTSIEITIFTNKYNLVSFIDAAIFMNSHVTISIINLDFWCALLLWHSIFKIKAAGPN